MTNWNQDKDTHIRYWFHVFHLQIEEQTRMQQIVKCVQCFTDELISISIFQQIEYKSPYQNVGKAKVIPTNTQHRIAAG